jgi:hypothetical protein
MRRIGLACLFLLVAGIRIFAADVLPLCRLTPRSAKSSSNGLFRSIVAAESSSGCSIRTAVAS